MRILLLGNNWVGWQVAQWLKKQNEQIVGLVIHPPQKRKYGEEIIRSAQLSPEYIFDGSQLRQPEVLEAIKVLQPDVGLSVFLVTSCDLISLICFLLALSTCIQRTCPTIGVPIPTFGASSREHRQV